MWAGPEEQLDKYHTLISHISKVWREPVGKCVFMLREGREVDRQVSRQLELFSDPATLRAGGYV